MDTRDSVHHSQEHEHSKQTQYVYGKSFAARIFGAGIDRLKAFETSVNTSTFGRVFRLDGSGHVSQSSILMVNVRDQLHRVTHIC